MAENARIHKELKEIQLDVASGVDVTLKNGSLRHMIGTIQGPSSSPYEGGTFNIEVQLPEAYPFEPPKMKFLTKVWHPNVSSQSGAICLDILKDQWSPALTLKTALLSVQALLASPEPKDPQDAVVAKQYMSEYDTFVSTAKYWTESYARGATDVDKVNRLMEMGFGEAAVTAALKAAVGDENAALEALLSQA